MILADLGDACGDQPNQRACDGLAFASCDETSNECECDSGFEVFLEVCSCEEGQTVVDEDGCRPG